MRIDELTRNLVRADSKEARNGFRFAPYGSYVYLVPMKGNETTLYIRRSIQEGRSIFIEPEYVLVFNVRNNKAGIVLANRMVEPVEFTVQMEGKK